MELLAGTRLKSAVCDTEVVVVRPPTKEVQVACGGQPMVEVGAAPPDPGVPAAGHDQGTLLGKRYSDEESGLQVLCSKAGKGSLSVDGRVLEFQQAKPLPASD